MHKPALHRVTWVQAAEVPAEDRAAIEQVNDAPSFPNPLPTEFGLLLRRAWKQQSRDRLPQVQSRGCIPSASLVAPWSLLCRLAWPAGGARLRQPAPIVQ